MCDLASNTVLNRLVFFTFIPSTVVARGFLPPGANVCFAAPYQIGNIITISMMVICVKLWTV